MAVTRFKDAHLKSTPRFKDDIFFQKQGAPQIYNYHRGVAFLPHGAPKITAVVHLQSCTESGLLLLTLLRAGMERFLPSASGSSAAGLKPCGEPTCKFKSQLVTSVHQCPCGRSMHGFCGRGIGKEGHGQQRECTDCQKRTTGDKTGSSSSPTEVDDEDDEQDNSR